MKGQKFTPVAPHIHAGRINAQAIGGIESAKNRTKKKLSKILENYIERIKNEGDLNFMYYLQNNIDCGAVIIDTESGLALDNLAIYNKLKEMIFDIEKKNICDAINNSLYVIEQGDLRLLFFLKLEIIEAENIGITIVNKETGLTLEKIKTMIPDLEKKYTTFNNERMHRIGFNLNQDKFNSQK